MYTYKSCVNVEENQYENNIQKNVLIRNPRRFIVVYLTNNDFFFQINLVDWGAELKSKYFTLKFLW